MIISASIVLSSCVSMAPVSSSFDSAKIQDKGQMEFLCTYSAYLLRAEDETEKKVTRQVNNNFGLRLRY